MKFRIGFLAIIVLSLSSVGFNKSELKIEIARSFASDSCTMGYLYVNGKPICYTMELPWIDNIGFISCIPKGTYSANIRFDKSDKWRIQLIGVPYRTGVQIHVGNYTKQIQGCVLVGTGVNTSQCTISGSTDAYKLLKNTYELENLLDGSGLSVTFR